MSRRISVALLSAIAIAALSFAPGKADDGAGTVAPAAVAQDWSVPVRNWKPVAAGEHPRLIFRKDDVAALRKRATTPAGRTIIERAKSQV